MELTEIKKIRKSIGLSQIELANLANVSQSLIAKVEAGTLDPTYTKTKQIFEALENAGKKQEKKAEEVMAEKLISVKPDDNIKDAIKKMKKYGISQMPVIDDHKAVGLVSEAILLEALLEGTSTAIKDVMKDAPPLISKDSSIKVVSDLLKHYPMVLVGEKGKLKGAITKYDLLSKVFY